MQSQEKSITEKKKRTNQLSKMQNKITCDKTTYKVKRNVMAVKRILRVLFPKEQNAIQTLDMKSVAFSFKIT